jgi:hypothetical protein
VVALEEPDIRAEHPLAAAAILCNSGNTGRECGLMLRPMPDNPICTLPCTGKINGTNCGGIKWQANIVKKIVHDLAGMYGSVRVLVCLCQRGREHLVGSLNFAITCGAAR